MSDTYQTIDGQLVRNPEGDTAEQYAAAAMTVAKTLSRLAGAIHSTRDRGGETGDRYAETADQVLAGGNLNADTPMGELVALLGIAERAAWRLYGAACQEYRRETADAYPYPERWTEPGCECGAATSCATTH